MISEMGIAASLLLLTVVSVIPGDLPFSRWFTAHDHGIEVQIARMPEGPPWLRGVAEVSAPAGRVFALLADLRRYPRLFGPPLEKARVLEEAGSGARVHLVWRTSSPTLRRDAVALYRAERLTDGAFVVSWDSDARGGDPREGSRITRFSGETRVEPVGESRSRVSYTFLGELDSRLPQEAREKQWRQQPVLYIR